ncbi:TPA: hypothetical protein ACKP9T_002639 [Pseudomonas aeruginosa]|uniref:Uncharacterized protein n=1 Tax=Pseudomonas phage vB_Pae_CF78a TaxID=2563592 RepID=A0A481V5C7_9CAUD|nr:MULTISPECIES: hypothetical protein [Pseudomonas]YP_010774053.1 hypothetical protein QJS23_gp56 [Pseudomonas phage vB_Pae_CF78a]QBI83898.1 hypothetical protein [Pseudomonas phage vB_Pae_CF125a]QBI84106.1 hypothetical protein [Pseudomonas phage vB_Pae_BR141c]AUA76417.1 hypothetical protein CWI21_09845 [Pseudomonas aeruginosa]AUA78461.1 hypothetical protein CWI21_20820 [Pseudomonas aeruginosa]AUB01042.1 hypothetical protein CWI20_09845 [Pseudomonas aeruginosa]
MTIDWSMLKSPEDQQVEQREAIRAQRRQAYRDEADPLRLEAEFDAIAAGTEPDLAAWVAAVQAIKARYPLPE